MKDSEIFEREKSKAAPRVLRANLVDFMIEGRSAENHCCKQTFQSALKVKVLHQYATFLHALY